MVNFKMHFCYSETAAKEPQPICDLNKTGPRRRYIHAKISKSPVKLRLGYCITQGRKGHG